MNTNVGVRMPGTEYRCGAPTPDMCGRGRTLDRSSVMGYASLSFARSPAALQRPLLSESGCMEGGRHLLGGWKPQSPPPLPGPLPASPPARPRSGPALAAAASRAASERTEAGGARGGRSARQGTLRREPSRDRGRPRGGLNGGSAVETPGAAGRARLVSVAAGSRGAGEETPASPAPSRGLSRGSSVPPPPRF